MSKQEEYEIPPISYEEFLVLVREAQKRDAEIRSLALRKAWAKKKKRLLREKRLSAGPGLKKKAVNN